MLVLNCSTIFSFRKIIISLFNKHREYYCLGNNWFESQFAAVRHFGGIFLHSRLFGYFSCLSYNIAVESLQHHVSFSGFRNSIFFSPTFWCVSGRVFYTLLGFYFLINYRLHCDYLLSSWLSSPVAFVEVALCACKMEPVRVQWNNDKTRSIFSSKWGCWQIESPPTYNFGLIKAQHLSYLGRLPLQKPVHMLCTANWW